MKHLTLALLLSLVTGCVGGVETWTVEPALQPCWGVGPQMCMQVTPEGGDRELLYSGVSGFTFEWGVTQTIEVQVTPVPNPPADGSSVDYDLIEVVDSQPVGAGTQVQLTLGADHLSAGSPGQFSLLGTTVNVPDAALEADIQAALDAGETRNILFEYGGGNTLTALSLN